MLLVLIWVQTVCKGYQAVTKVTAIKGRVNYKRGNKKRTTTNCKVLINWFHDLYQDTPRRDTPAEIFITETLKLQNVDHRNRFKLTVMLVVKISYGDSLGLGNESLIK